MNLFEQTEWRGIARKGKTRRDPFTSKMEINTQPGDMQLRKLRGREPYLSSRMPTVAFHSPHPITGWRLINSNGTEISNLNKNAGELFIAYVCFRVIDLLLLDTANIYPLFTSGYLATTDDMAWGFYLEHDGTDWHIGFCQQDDNVPNYINVLSTTNIVSGSWYWCKADLSGSAPTIQTQLTIYKDGSDSELETPVTDSSGSRTSFTSGGNVYLGHYCPGLSIAYAALGSTSATVSPWKPFLPESGGEFDIAFYPLDGTRSVQPALIEDSSTKTTWQFWPKLGIEQVEVSSATSGFYDAKGVLGSNKQSLLDLSHVDLFSKRTVLLFMIRQVSTKHVLFATEDSMFRIEVQSDAVHVWWPPLDRSLGSESYGQLCHFQTAADFTGSYEWIAVELNPTKESGANNLTIYQYTGGAWDDTPTTTGSSGTRIGGGIEDISPQKAYFHKVNALSNTSVYDFRIILGDDDWQTNHTPSSMTTFPSSNLVLWLNHDEGTRWPNLDKVATAVLSNDNDPFSPVIGLSDRVTGRMVLTASLQQSLPCLDGCEYMDKGPYPRISDFRVEPDGTIVGISDAYFFEDTTPTIASRQIVGHLAKTGSVGKTKYLVSTAPMQVFRERFEPVGIPDAYMDSYASGTAHASASLDFMGGLTPSSDFRYKVTIYDPYTGNESNPHGPFAFETVVATSSCAFAIESDVYATRRLDGFYARLYRYHSGDGAYYLDGEAPISELDSDSTYKIYMWKSRYRFSKSDDDLSLMKLLEENNNPPPIYKMSHISGGRAFYVDAINPSRIWFSKLYQTAAVPGWHIIWTDEGWGGEILGFLDAFGGILLLREQSIWIIPQFQVADQAFAQELLPAIGCVSGRAAVFAHGILWWASPAGIYSWDGENVPINHSDRLRGLDQQIWDHDPRRTVAYFDQRNFRVIFVCDGSGIAIDINTGAVALFSAPESSYAEAATSAYSGALYGGEGMIWKEVVGNLSLSLDFDSSTPSGAAGLNGTDDLSELYWYWAYTHGTDDYIGSERCAFQGSAFFSSGTSVLTSASLAGRTITGLNDDKDDVWTNVIMDITSPSTAIVRSTQPSAENFTLDRYPFYYRSQEIFLGRMADSRRHHRLDLLTGEIEAATDVVADITTKAFVPGESDFNSVRNATAELTHKDVLQMHLQNMRGNQFEYSIFHAGTVDAAEIEAVGIYFTEAGPRNRKTT